MQPYRLAGEATILLHPLHQSTMPMPHSMTLSVRLALVVLLMGPSACSSDLVLPETEQAIGAVNIDGDRQTGTVGEPLEPLVVEVLTERQTPVEGVEVSFELLDLTAGLLSPRTTTTNSQGRAVATWTLGTVPGSYVALARLVGVDAVEAQDSLAFHAAAEPAAPDTLSAVSSRNQPGQRREEVGDPPLVRVVDRYGNQVPSVGVDWQVISGEGQVTSPRTTTDAAGEASVAWTLGNRIGVHKLSASIQGSSLQPVIFEARVAF
jgi:hypothetical protein